MCHVFMRSEQQLQAPSGSGTHENAASTATAQKKSEARGNIGGKTQDNQANGQYCVIFLYFLSDINEK